MGGSPLLRLAGVALFVAAVALVLVDGLDADKGGYETGKVLGTGMRDVFFGLVAAVLVGYLLRSAERTQGSWKDIPDDAMFVGGLVAVTIAVLTGAPRTEEEVQLANSADCREAERNPIEAMPASVQLSDAEIRSLPDNQEIPDDFLEVSDTYVTGTLRKPVVATVVAVGDSEEDHATLRTQFTSPMLATGAAQTQFAVNGSTALQFTGAGGSAIYARKGCWALSVVSQNGDALRGTMTRILSGASPTLERRVS